ncbi:MAG: hypothetical protein Q9201_004139 [Fulgogasparrea decipioides]
MTPVRVRGKRGQRARQRALREQRALQEQRAQHATNGQPAVVSPDSAVKPTSSKLECLPTEILESIFLYSQNFALPSVSLTLCRALASPHLKHLTLCSFLTVSDDESSNLGRIQSQLLRCRWMDLAMLRRAQKDHKLSTLRYGCEVPTKVLHGPWTNDKIEMLRLLKKLRAKLDWETSNNGEVADQSLKEAIIQGNAPMVDLLLNRWEPYPNIYTCIVPVTQEHLRLAILQGGCRRNIIDDILHAGRVQRDLPDLHLGDSDIVDWAIEKKAHGDERGSWLLDLVSAEGTCT